MEAGVNLLGKRVAALIPAAGSGRRMGGPVLKPFLQLKGREILARTLDVFERCHVIDEVWVVVPDEHRVVCQKTIIERYGFQKVQGVVAGGATRQASVWQGLQQVKDDVELVVVHDGVRPFVSASLVQETLHQAVLCGAAIAAVPLKDTLKRVAQTGEVECTVPRDRLWRIQTPQAFQRHVLLAAFQHALAQGLEATDEAGLVEAHGRQRVCVVPGMENNVKVTTPDDLLMCESLLDYLN
ncbi:MAG: 2-C-methyl-D-erythritol 4-phosphate cytidylyltransferase [bacterium]|nr:2-C-methyl-D-erythritol 4-phosphate cytidylyltransferase [bacterium]